VGASREAATIGAQELAVLGDGAEVQLSGRAARSRAILVAGRPLREPVARYGPFVMNTREEIMQAFTDFQSGRF
jgi:redox-sensitive bicupin YhaK (pirin superfamily)